MKYSANLGLLWTELKIDQAIHHANKYNFVAVEVVTGVDRLPTNGSLL